MASFHVFDLKLAHDNPDEGIHKLLQHIKPEWNGENIVLKVSLWMLKHVSCKYPKLLATFSNELVMNYVRGKALPYILNIQILK